MKGSPDLENVRILGTDRLSNSVNGNPRYRLILDLGDYPSSVGSFLTSSDAACSYDVDNLAHSGERFHAWLTRSGRIQVIERAA